MLSTSSFDPARLAGEYLTFRLGAEEYAIGILKVQEIRSYEEPTRIANAPPFVKGVTNLRGVIVPIVDLRLKLNCPEAEFGPSTVVVVLNVGDLIVGVIVDAVSDVVDLQAGHIKAAPAMAHTAEGSFISGIASVQTEGKERTLVLIDIENLLAGTGLSTIARQ
ncbi:chemotaxis protein CheW [Xylophilus rhododendri]|nr:chemotaxis protein CheW [Xylophilus rhododendri]